MQHLKSSSCNAVRAAGAALLLLLGPIVGEAGAADPTRKWIAQTDDAASSLIYGTPESDDVALSLSCDHSTRMLTLWYAMEPAYTKDPKELLMDLHSEGGSVALTGKGRRSELDDAYALEATTPLTPELDALLAKAVTLEILVEDGTVEFPIDAAAREGIDAIRKGCGT